MVGNRCVGFPISNYKLYPIPYYRYKGIGV